MASIYKEISDKLTDDTKTWAGALGSIFNGCSRFFWASLQDKYGFRKIYLCVSTIQLVSSLLLYPMSDNSFVFVALICSSFMCEGAHFACFPAACVRIFGLENGPHINSFLLTAISFSSLSSLAIVVFFKEWIDFRIVFMIASALTLLNIIVIYRFDDREMDVDGGRRKG